MIMHHLTVSSFVSLIASCLSDEAHVPSIIFASAFLTK